MYIKPNISIQVRVILLILETSLKFIFKYILINVLDHSTKKLSTDNDKRKKTQSLYQIKNNTTP